MRDNLRESPMKPPALISLKQARRGLKFQSHPRDSPRVSAPLSQAMPGLYFHINYSGNSLLRQGAEDFLAFDESRTCSSPSCTNNNQTFLISFSYKHIQLSFLKHSKQDIGIKIGLVTLVRLFRQHPREFPNAPVRCNIYILVTLAAP